MPVSSYHPRVLPEPVRPPVCLILTKLFGEELRLLKSELAKGWDSITEELDQPRRFSYPKLFTASSQPKYLEPAALSQIYALARYVDIHFQQRVFVIIDPLSGRNQTVLLAQFVREECQGHHVKLGRLPAQRAARAVVDLPRGIPSFEMMIDAFPGMIELRDQLLQFGGIDRFRNPVSVSEFPEYNRSASSKMFNFRLTGTDPIITSLIAVGEAERVKLCDKIEECNKGLNQYCLITEDAVSIMNTRYGLRASLLAADHPPEDFIYGLFIDAETLTDGKVILACSISSGVYCDYSVGYQDRSCIKFCRIPFNEICEVWREAQSPQAQEQQILSKYVLDDYYIETLLDYSMPLDWRMPPYALTSSRSLVVFFLSSFPDAGVKALRSALETQEHIMGFRQRSYIYYRWIGAESVDSDVNDMLRIMSYTGFNNELKFYIFVDLTSFVDDTVIVAEYCHLGRRRRQRKGSASLPEYIEFNWMRIPPRIAYQWRGFQTRWKQVASVARKNGVIVSSCSSTMDQVAELAREAEEMGLVESEARERASLLEGSSFGRQNISSRVELPPRKNAARSLFSDSGW